MINGNHEQVAVLFECRSLIQLQDRFWSSKIGDIGCAAGDKEEHDEDNQNKIFSHILKCIFHHLTMLDYTLREGHVFIPCFFYVPSLAREKFLLPQSPPVIHLSARWISL